MGTNFYLQRDRPVEVRPSYHIELGDGRDKTSYAPPAPRYCPSCGAEVVENG